MSDDERDDQPDEPAEAMDWCDVVNLLADIMDFLVEAPPVPAHAPLTSSAHTAIRTAIMQAYALARVIHEAEHPFHVLTRDGMSHLEDQGPVEP